MSSAVTYELCVFYDGQWKVDSLYDDREIALYEAQRVLARSHCTGVRIAEERFRESTATYETRTIFRKTRVDGSNDDGLERERKSRRDAEARTRAAELQNANSYNETAGPVSVQTSIEYGLIFRVLLGAVIILAGIGAILALRSFH